MSTSECPFNFNHILEFLHLAAHSYRIPTMSQVPEGDTQEYIGNLERLDMVLANIERYVLIAFAALRKEDVVQRMFTMVS